MDRRFGIMCSEQLKWRLSAFSSVSPQYVEICLITYRFSVKIGLVYEVLCAIKLVLNYPMESFYIAVVCRATRRDETMLDPITRKRLLKSAPSCASGRHYKLRPVVRLHRYCSQIYADPKDAEKPADTSSAGSFIFSANLLKTTSLIQSNLTTDNWIPLGKLSKFPPHKRLANTPLNRYNLAKMGRIR